MNKMTATEAGKLGGAATRLKRLSLYADNPNRCTYCKELLPYSKRHNKFCNRSCAASLNNKGVRRHGENPSTCILCGNPKNSYKSSFCSHACHNNYQWQQRKEFVRVNGVDALGEAEWVKSTFVKKYLLETEGRKCKICGITEWMNTPVPLVLDHVNGNSQDWCWENLRFVCGNCNMLLPTFTSRNMGNGRKWRRERDREESKRRKSLSLKN